MAYPIKESNWIVQCDGKLTFFGVLQKYFDDIAIKYRLSSCTREGYAREYEHHILPLINEKPLEDYSAEDFEEIISLIDINRKGNAPSTLKHYRQLIERVIDCAVEKEGMKNPLWGVLFEEITTPKQVEEREKRTMPKSLTPLQHIVLGEHIYNAADSFGQAIGHILTYECGFRMKESAGCSVGDYQDQQSDRDFTCVAVHTSTIKQGHERQDKLKTANGHRIGILGPRATQKISNKIAMLHKMVSSEEIVLDPDSTTPVIEAIPLANASGDLLIPCSSHQLSQGFRHLIRDAGYDHKDYVAAQRIVESKEFLEAEESVTPTELGFAAERDISAYVLRRQFCTDMHIVGCTKEERQYAMGHKIDNPSVDRRDFRNSDRLDKLGDKMLKRPSVNPDVLKPKQINMEGESYHNPDFHTETITVPAKKGKYIIRITSHEAFTPAVATITIPEGTEMNCQYRERKSHLPQRQVVNVLNDYYNEYGRAYATLKEKNGKKTEQDPE